MYTFVIRSKDRVYGNTSDFRITLPYNPELARSHYWKVTVPRVIIPRTNFYQFWFDGNATFPSDELFNPSEFAEVHLDFGTACKGHDTNLNGAGDVTHIVTNRTTDRSPTRSSHLLYESVPTDVVSYEIARPNLSELRVQVLDKFGRHLKGTPIASFPTFVADTDQTLLTVEQDIPEWLLVVQIEPIEKYVE